MKVITAEYFGICFGVRDAIAQAQALAREAPLTILGELVHNPIVRAQLRALGIREEPSDRAPGLFRKRRNQSIGFARWSRKSGARIQAPRFDSQTRFANRQKTDSSRLKN